MWMVWKQRAGDCWRQYIRALRHAQLLAQLLLHANDLMLMSTRPEELQIQLDA